jgi:hypothetical protein
LEWALLYRAWHGQRLIFESFRQIFLLENDGIGGAGCFYTDCTTFIGGFIVLVSTS